MYSFHRFLLLLVLASVFSGRAHGQGTILFNNRVTGTSTDSVVAPIFGPEPNDPFVRKYGNPATYPTPPIPVGTQTYSGTPLVGTGYTASLWTRPAGSTNEFVMTAKMPFRTTTSASLKGFWQVPATLSVVSNVPSDASIRAECIVRVWENRDGTIADWNALNSLSNSNVLRGYSEPFVVPDQLGNGGGLLGPKLAGLQSFCLTLGNTNRATLTVSSQGQGSVTKAPDQPEYDVGAQVAVEALPARWHAFAGWTDGSTSNPRVVSIHLGPNIYTAAFSPTTTVETLVFGGVTRVAPVGMPAIFVDNEFMTSNTVERLNAATVSLSTTFTNGFIFYSLDGSTPSLFSEFYTGSFPVKRTCTIRAIAYDASLALEWEADPVLLRIVPTYPISAESQGGGTVSVSPALTAFRSNEVATLTALPSSGWTFLHWLGDVTGTNPSVNVLVDRPLCAEAIFGTTVLITPLGNGVVARDPQIPLLPYGSTLRLTALPASSSQFTRWGSALGSNNPVQLRVTAANMPVTAQFSDRNPGTYSLLVQVAGEGRVLQNPHGNAFPGGQAVVLVAAADNGVEFLGWSGDATGSQQNLTVTMDKDKVITASFGYRLKLDVWSCDGLYPAGRLRTILSSRPGEVVSIDTSDDLEHWTPMLTATNHFGRWQMDVPTIVSNRFYRANADR